MYTLQGLKRIAEFEQSTLPIDYLQEALDLLDETIGDLEKTTRFLQETCKIEVVDQYSDLQTRAIPYREVASSSQKEIEKKLFIQLYELTEEASEINKEVYALLNEYFARIHFKPIDSTYLVLKGNSLSFHQLGLFNYASDMFITVAYESEDYYMGSFWYSNFFNVKFQKSDVRPLTAEEKRQENLA